MPYTEFRKSYGDFEVVIPAIDFSSLSSNEALVTKLDLKQYHLNYRFELGIGYVCYSVPCKAGRIISNTIDPRLYGLERFIVDSLMDDDFRELFKPYTPAGKLLRIEWCKHMANEIEREHGV